MLRNALRTGAYKAGERIREAEIASRLKMSRTPVREALQRLQAEGLVGFESRRGIMITTLDSQQITELYVMREILECIGAQLAARHASDAEIAVLQELAKEEARIGDHRQKLIEHNRRFHTSLSHSAHNRYLLKLLGSLDNSFILLEQNTYTAPGIWKKSLDAHRAIVDAVATRDPNAADMAARSHTRSAFKNRLRILMEEWQE